MIYLGIGKEFKFCVQKCIVDKEKLTTQEEKKRKEVGEEGRN